MSVRAHQRRGTRHPIWLVAWVTTLGVLLALAVFTSHSWLGLARHVTYALIDSVMAALALLVVLREWRGALALGVVLLVIAMAGAGLNTVIRPLSWLLSLTESVPRLFQPTG